MKKLILTYTLALSFVQYSQAQSTKISYISPKMDTLMLPNNELGEMICMSWTSVDTTKNRKPIIIVTDEDTINDKNNMTYQVRRKKSKK